MSKPAAWIFFALALPLSGDRSLSNPAPPAPDRGPSLTARVQVQPDDVAVFAGSALAFQARIIGAAATPADIHSVVSAQNGPLTM